MAAERDAIEIDSNPELLRLVEEMEATGQTCVLRKGGKDVAVLQLVPTLPEPRATTADSALWKLIGIGRSEGPTDVATNKHKYLAEAYADLHDAESDDRHE